MKSLITGISGFVGPYLANHLLKNNHKVFGFDRSGAKLKNSKTFSCDLLDKKRLSAVLSKTKPDYIFHLAAQSSVESSWHDPVLTKRINVEGTKNLLDSVLKNKLKSKLLIVSSAEVYGIPKELPVKENSQLKPLNPYAESRVQQEKLVLGYCEKYSMDIVISRSFNHAGPGQPSNFVCSDFAKQIAEVERNKREIVNVGNLNVKRDFTDVRDIVIAYLLALESCDSGEIYNICSGKAYSIKKILKLLLSKSNKKVRIKQDPSRMRKIDVPIMIGDNAKFRQKTGWKPEIPFEKTLGAILDYWREII